MTSINLTLNGDLTHSLIDVIYKLGTAYPNLQSLSLTELTSDEIELSGIPDTKYFPLLKSFSYKSQTWQRLKVLLAMMDLGRLKVFEMSNSGESYQAMTYLSKQVWIELGQCMK